MPTNPNGKYNEVKKGEEPRRKFMYTAKDVESDEVTQIKKDIVERIILCQNVNSEQLSVSCAKYGIGVHIFLKWLDMDGMQAYKDEFALTKHRTYKLNPQNLSNQALAALAKVIEDPTEIVVVQKKSSDGKVVTETRTKKNRELQTSASKFVLERTSMDYSLALKTQFVNGALELLKIAATHPATTPEHSDYIKKLLSTFLIGRGINASELDLDAPDIVDIVDSNLPLDNLE
jgi:hypothetical protein